MAIHRAACLPCEWPHTTVRCDDPIEGGSSRVGRPRRIDRRHCDGGRGRAVVDRGRIEYAPGPHIGRQRHVSKRLTAQPRRGTLAPWILK